MSQEDVENLRTWATAWEAPPAGGPMVDCRTGEPVTNHLDLDVVYEDAFLPDHAQETYRGHQGVIRATDRWAEPFEDLRVELERIVDAGACLVSIHRFRARAKHTGIEFDEPLAILWRFRGGRVVYFRSFRDSDDALEAAGLSSSRH
ncbi:MAG TPA: nuclear transport factor 2 family protein [Thermoleophilaceae bacterium]